MHIAIIPDGNRRYMKKQGITDISTAYSSGIQKFKEVTKWCIEFGVKELTVYSLSIENLQRRSKMEIKPLLTLFSREAKKLLRDKEIRRNKVKINICGDRDLLRRKNKSLYRNLRKLEEVTRGHKKFTLNLAIAYGGRQEILNAAEMCSYGELPFTENSIREFLWVKSYPDIIIRTAETRLSNFLTFQSAYSKIYFVDKLWQEFEREDLKEIISNFKK